MKRAFFLTFLLSLVFTAQLMVQESPIFPKGRVATIIMVEVLIEEMFGSD